MRAVPDRIAVPRAPIAFVRAPRRLPVPGWALAIGAGWLLLVGVHEILRPPDATSTVCVFRAVTGVPCATCGSSRAVRAAVAGQPLVAVAHNPLVVTGAIAALGWAALRLLFARTIVLGRGGAARRGSPSRWMWAGLLAVFVANWAWVIARHAG